MILLKEEYQEFKRYNVTIQQEMERVRHLDATVSINLSEHPLYNVTPRYRMRSYVKQY